MISYNEPIICQNSLLDQALQKGIEAHKAGKVREADQYYRDNAGPAQTLRMPITTWAFLAVGVGCVQALPFFKTALDELTQA